MKIIGRIFIIMVVALVIAGVVLAFSGTSLAAYLAPNSPQGRFYPQGESGYGLTEVDGDAANSGFPERGTQDGFQGEMHTRGGFEAGLGWFTWVKNLSIIGIIILGVVSLNRIRFHKRH